MRKKFFLSIGLFALMGSAAMPAGADAPLSAAETFIYQGKAISEQQAFDVINSGDAEGITYLDPDEFGVAGRVFVTEEQGDAWLRGNGLPVPPRGAALEALEAQSRERRAPSSAQSDPTDTAIASSCPTTSYGGKWYDGTYCAGAWSGIFENEAVPNMGDYGWNDRAESLILADPPDCVQWVRYYFAANYGVPYADRYEWNSPVNSLAGFNNEISSYKSQCS